METNLNVSLLTHTPEPEKYVASAARLCYSSSNIENLLDNLTEDKIASFVERLASLGHESPFEHVSFTFGVEGVSRSLTHQLVRHRIGASYSQKSQRYVSEGQFAYIIPPSIKDNKEAKEVFIKAMEDDQKKYDELVDILTKEHGDKKKAMEDARFILPNACETKIVVTMNARALFNFFALRCCNRAQWEIRALADEMLKLVKGVAPGIFKNSGPGCVRGKCPEGDMTCGDQVNVRKRYRNI